jgi:hypothetical protein
MSIIAIVGMRDDDEEKPIVGNGKTGTMVYFLHEDKFEDGKDIYTNIETTFSKKMRTFEILDSIRKGDIDNCSIGVDELTGFLNSLGSKSSDVIFTQKVMSQLRKKDIDMYWTGQRFNDAVNRVRFFTDTILLPYKTHEDDSPCYDPKCKKHHYIYVYAEKPFKMYPLVCLDMVEVGKLYDTNEFVDDALNLPSEREKRIIADELKKMKVSKES